ncbi:MAG: hypothetical protein SNJ67_03180 [Chloracidobacterium sp.]|uniref:Uncharacterized protein n=1 Tax=Chloracidobacterium validum TaxID=2821543 RepID=A0ABX8BBP7_9BACT|nr:hypothetical protein [Chloracidobacterium validum]QUW04358.1 hypothetical protein J8C06_11185 [Chloracidobacterium validum]
MASLPLPLISIANGLALIALSIIGYVLKDPSNSGMTAFIPGGFGLLFLVFGALALKENLRKHAMHAVSAVALLGVLGGLVPILMSLAKGNFGARPLALGLQIGMVLLCGEMLALCVNSFIQARRRREREAAG